MSELSAILTAEDKLDFAAWLRAEHVARFVVDDDAPAITEITQLEALRSVLLQEFPPLIFVLSDQWSSLPLFKHKAMNQYKGEIHYVAQRYGGPAFNLDAWKLWSQIQWTGPICRSLR